MTDDGYDYDIHDIDLDAVELFLLKPATPGPWRDDDVYGLVSPTKIDGFAFPQERAEAEGQIRADTKLAAHSRTLLPALVERLRIAEETIERVRGLASELANSNERAWESAAAESITAVLDGAA